MTQGRHDVSLVQKTKSSLPGGLGVNATAGLLPGENIVSETLTTTGEGIVLTEARLLLVRAGIGSGSLGQCHAFTFDQIQNVTLKEHGFIPKLRVDSVRPFEAGHELSVIKDEKHMVPLRALLERLGQAMPITGRQTHKPITIAPRSKLPGKLGDAINATLRSGEDILREIHTVGEGMVVTTDRVLIVKGGSAAQAMFGQKVKSFQYDVISSVEVSAGAIFGRIQITVPGAWEGSGRSSLSNTAQMENVVQINRPMLAQAREIANVIEQRMAEARRPTVVVAAAPAPAPVSLSDELMKLASLRDAGVLTSEEFEAAKARLLNL